ncbi:MAG: hypothetical protein WCP52_13540 [Bacteroidota bacterium]
MDTSINSIQLFQILKLKLGEKEAEALVSFVESKIKEENEHNLKTNANKEDISLLKIEIKETKVDLIKWMVGFWIAQMAAIIGLYITKH